MEKAAILKMFQKAVATLVVSNKPILPVWIQDADPEISPQARSRSSTPPTSPCEEVIVISADGTRVIESVGFRVF